MYSNIQQAVASVRNAPSSIFTKEDVVKLLESIKVEEERVGLTTAQIEQLCESILDQIKGNVSDIGSDAVDTDSAEFELNGNEISLYCVDLDTREIANQAVNGIAEIIEEFFEELAEEDEQETLEIPGS